MWHRRVVIGVCVALFGCGFAAHAGDDLYKAAAGSMKVTHRDAEWKDPARDREVPVRIYEPRREEPAGGAEEKLPLIVFSHGMGGSRNGYAYIAEHLASCGYIVILPTHAGSDTEAVRKEIAERIKKRVNGEGTAAGAAAVNGLIAENTSDPDNLKNRPLDISFVIDHALGDETLSKEIDAAKIGVAGHSFGAYTAMAVAGMLVDLPGDKDHSFREKRVKAVLPMSPQGRGAMGVNDGAWVKVDAPVMFLTGTRDYGQGEKIASWRREAFDAAKTPAADEYLIVIEDATHMAFADNAGARLRPNAEISPQHAEHVKLIEASATAFFDAYLRDDAKAKEWLKAYFAEKHKECTAEFKAGAAAP